MDEQEVDAALEGAFGSDLDLWFYSKIVGVKRHNWDGIARVQIIEDCAEGEALHLVPEPDNEFDLNAIMVLRHPDGAQLGYLDRHAAEQVARDRDGSYFWLAILTHHNRHPETDVVVGANIAVVRLRFLPDDSEG